MNIRERFNDSAFLRADDIPTQGIVVTIEGVEVIELADEDRVLVSFRGASKGLVLNKTNANTLADLLGEETDGWLGRKITLRREQVDYRGKKTWGVRVGASAAELAKSKSKSKKYVPEEQEHPENSDDLPF